MPEHVKITTPDSSILRRISERDVVEWIAAKMQHIRGSLQCSNLQLQANFRNYRDGQYFDVDWSIHGLDKCALTHKSIELACMELHEELMNNPKSRAAEARRKANDLLKEAAALEAVSELKPTA